MYINAERLNQGVLLHQKGMLAEAKQIYESILQEYSANAKVLNLLGTLEGQLGNVEKAISLLREAIQLSPDYFGVHYNLGNVFAKIERWEEALVHFDKALLINTQQAEVYLSRSAVLKHLNYLDKALADCNMAIALSPQYAEAFNTRGVIFQELNDNEKALKNYNQAVLFNPQYAEAFNNRGFLFGELGLWQEARQDYEQAIQCKPDYVDAFYNKGIALKELNLLEESLNSYEQAIKLDPDHTEALNNYGNVLKDLNRSEESLTAFEKAIKLKPDYAKAFNNKGLVLADLNRLEEALFAYEKALALKFDYPFLWGVCLHLKTKLCNWHGVEKTLIDLISDIEQRGEILHPFPVMHLYDFPRLQQIAMQVYVEDQCTKSIIEYPPFTHVGDKRITIGYYSADFYNHVVSHLVAGLFERHDKLQFRCIAFSLGADKEDEMRQRLRQSFEEFIPVKTKNTDEIVCLSRQMGIDIAVDLTGFTRGCRPQLFFHRCAPIQINYLGFPGTMGMKEMDYIIADSVLITPETRPFYTEKIIYMPDTYQCNDRNRIIADKIFTRTECNLPEQGFIFCCFNNSYKIMPETFAIWMDILKSVEGSVLWLLDTYPTTKKNLKQEAKERGVNSERLIFAPKMAPTLYLARYRTADLFLDTLPCNAHATASDALWAGCPVLTRKGSSFASRVSASLLTAIDLPELITEDKHSYQEMAIHLAKNPEQLTLLKIKLANNRLTTPLFDTGLWTKNLETAYREIYQKHQQGKKPEDLRVANATYE